MERQSVSLEKQSKIGGGQGNGTRGGNNPYLTSAKALLQNHKNSMQKLKDKSVSILSNNQ